MKTELLHEWREVELGNLIKIISGQAPPSSSYNKKKIGLPFLRVNSFNKKYPSTDTYTNDSLKECKKGDILLSVAGTIGSINISDKKYSITRSIFALRTKEMEINNLYLYYFLKTLKNKLMSSATGTSQKIITIKIVENIKIPLPSLFIQEKIVSILEKSEKVMDLRKEANELTNDFIKSVFFEMFGNVITNDKNWELVQVNKVINSRLGKMLDSKKQTQHENRKYLRNTNVKWDYFDLDKVIEMDFNKSEREEFRLEKGDLLVCEGGDVGRSAIWNNELSECYFQKALHRIRCNTDKIIPEYLLYLFWYYSEHDGFKKIVNFSTIAHFTGIMLKNMVIPVPPISIQNKFSHILSSIKKTKLIQSESGTNIEKLSSFLEQDVFKVENNSRKF